MAKPRARAAAQPPREADEPKAHPKHEALSVEFSPEALDLLVRVCNGVRLTKDDVTLAIEAKEVAPGRVAVVMCKQTE